MTPPKPTRSEAARSQSQSDRFAEIARALGADDDEAAFKAKLGMIARQKLKEPPLVADKLKGQDAE